MKHLFYVAMATLFFAACSKNNYDNSSINTTDNDYMVQASFSNLAEISAGAIAGTNGNADSVKMFGVMMIQDHGAAETSLDSLATALQVAIPSEPDDAHKAKAAYLQTLSGYTFDTAYINAQVIDHAATIAIFKTEITSGNNAKIKTFASDHLPVIQMHYQMALDIQTQLR